ncbi:tetratricopeptide repeat protein [Glycomyces salinus]|uniref:tetratricopeptide repeat protein n=1 Tax=Glycomyces salinus TaxID=980294 RepID=UPI0018ED5FC6|nr:tetratricopeptide repeat protein [Glycomyces salinus]
MRKGPATAGEREPEPEFGAVLKEYRERAGLTQRDLAERSDVSLAAIRDMEQGRSRRPRRESVRGLAAALELPDQDVARLFRAVFGASGPVAAAPVEPSTAARKGTTLGVLGPLTVWRDGVPVPLNSPKQNAILLRLALTAGEVVGRDQLMDLLWGEKPPASAANLLHTYIGRLRRLLQPDPDSERVLVTEAGGYRLSVAPDRLDLAQFRDLASRGAEASDPHQRLRRFEAAARLWRGETDVDALRGDPLMVAVTEEYAAMLGAWAATARDLGDCEQVLPRLRELAVRLELHEPLHAELVMTLAASGRRAEALAAFARVSVALADQLGIEPGERLRRAHRGALRERSDPEPEGDGRQTPVRQTPSPPPDFVGRERELHQVLEALGTDRPRTGSETPAQIVAVNGPAGVGKTALALQAASRLRDRYPDGQLYTDLHGVTGAPLTPMEVLGRFLRALGVPGGRIGADEAEAAALLRGELAGRRMLVVLDNARDAGQVAPLLPGPGACAVLVTGRRRLNDLVGATVIDLPTLPFADALDLLAATAGEQRIAAEPRAARQLAAACGHLPLALRIAGARLAGRRAWTAADLAGRLRDEGRRLSELTAGTSSVLASFHLSYQDLSETAQRAFRLCALHPGDDFGLDAVAAMLGVDPADADLILDELLDTNMLLQYTADRFRYHDLLGLYAARLLDEDAPERYEADRDRYYQWCLRTVTAAMEWVYPQLVRWSTCDDREAVFETQEAALDWLDTEAPALVALLEAIDTTVHSGLAWRIADQLRGYFFLHRQSDRWLRSAAAGLRAARTEGEPSAVAAMLMSRGQAKWSLGRHQEALEDYTEGARLADAGGWHRASAYLRHNIGLVLSEQGRLEEAERSFRHALELDDDELGHVRAVTLNGLGAMCADQGRLKEAVEYFTAALRINQKTRRQKSLLSNRSNLGMVLRQLGDEEAAEEHLCAALEGHRRAADMHGEMAALDELSMLHAQRGCGDDAVSAAEQGFDLATIVQDRRGQAALLTSLGEARLCTGDIAAAQDTFGQVIEMAAQYPFFVTRATVGSAASLLKLGEAAGAREHAERAANAARERRFSVLEAEALAVRARCEADVDPASAAATAKAAADLYRASGMDRLAERLQREFAA